MTVLILHGIMGKAGENWMQWLNDELSGLGCNVIMPTLPDADHPDRTEWLNYIIEIIGNYTDDLIIVGHSLGVTSALDYIEQARHKIKALFSVSGFATDYDLELNSYFLRQKSVDFDKVSNNLEQAFVFYSDDDPYVTQEALASVAKQLSVRPVVLHNAGHINSAAGFSEFPDLLKSILKVI